jgi:hypothetical protein
MDKRLEDAVATLMRERAAVPLHVGILTAAGFDPERTVTDYEGVDWGFESDGDMAEASVYRRVPLGHLYADDVNLLLLWGSQAAPLVELVLYYLERNPFAATNGLTYSAMLSNVASALGPAESGAASAMPSDGECRDRLSAVFDLAHAMIVDGRVGAAAENLYEDPVEMLREAEAKVGRRPG